jgi:hypothetical protein
MERLQARRISKSSNFDPDHEVKQGRELATLFFIT